jgi:microcystin-dependent protein
MPRNGQGLYSLPEAAFVPGTTISSAAVNSDYSDIASALTDSIAADGQTPISAPLRFPDGSASSPAITFVTNLTDGFYHPGSGVIAVALGGVQNFKFSTLTGPFAGGLLGVGDAVLIPVGITWDYPGGNAPTGWFFCYGQAVSRTTYSELFAIIGVSYGSGDGSTTFNLPDLRGRVVAGRDDMGGTPANRVTTAVSGINGIALGAAGGLQAVQLTLPQTPSATITGTTGGMIGYNAAGLTFGSNSVTQQNGSGGTFAPLSGPIGADGLNTHTHVTTASNGGGDQAHPNMQPTMIMNKIIFAGHP